MMPYQSSKFLDLSQHAYQKKHVMSESPVHVDATQTWTPYLRLRQNVLRTERHEHW